MKERQVVGCLSERGSQRAVWTRIARVAACALMVVVVGGCKQEAGRGPGGGPPDMKAPVPVRVGDVVQQTVPIEVKTIGSVEAYSTIAVKTQVSGELVEVLFKEGDMVEKGQVLFRIDPRPYEVALKQAEANLAKAVAQAEQSRADKAKNQSLSENAQREYERDADLVKRGSVSKEEFDTARANADALRATVVSNEAAIKSSEEAARGARIAIDAAKLQLDYCTIASPVDGKTGSLIVNQGNVVKANDTTPLVTINQVHPIYVTFSVPDKHLPAIRNHGANDPLEVKAMIRNDESDPPVGTLSFFDNSVNQSTGTIRLKATFPNNDNRLWPGLFVDAVLQVSVLPNAIVAPASAVQAGQSGLYAYVVKPDNTVELRTVQVLQNQDGSVIIKEGLNAGEKVVTDGQLRLANGATAKIVTDAPKAPDTAKSEEGK